MPANRYGRLWYAAVLIATFAAAPGESEYPLYFQKGEPAKGVLTLSFLETGTPALPRRGRSA